MSEATRAVALQSATALLTQAGGSAEEVLSVAQTFHDFLISDVTAAGKGAAATVATATVAAAKPATKPATKTTTTAAAAAKKAPAKTEEQLVSEAAAEGDEGATKENVGKTVEALLKANLRSDAIKLLKKFGASSVSGVKEDDYAAFIEEGQSLLPLTE